MATLTGKIFKVNPLQSGNGKNGDWKKQEVIIESNNGKYSKKVAVEFWNDLADTVFVVGNEISIEFDVESKEYNERWYTNAKAYKVVSNDTKRSSKATPTQNDDSDGLPF
jgi:hypothetical protein